MTLTAHVVVARGELLLDAELEVGSGEVLAVVGPNGAGKSTLLRAIAGLEPLRQGWIEIDGTRIDQLRAHERGVGVVFQDVLLFPHLSVLDNVAFGLRARGATRRDARHRAAQWLERIGLADYADRFPGGLSGGEAQRVALARALASEPRILLLDEPVSALDAGARAAARQELARHVATFEGPVLLVTHDPVDASLADQVIVLEDGQVVQRGTLEQITAQPRSRHVAAFLGINAPRDEVLGQSN